MLTSAHKSASRCRCHYGLRLVALLVAACCATSASAQMGGIESDPGDRAMGGRNTIQGTIFLPGGRRLDRRAKVKLVSISSVQHFKMSDENGAFAFRWLQGGTYTVTVDAGKEYEIASETVDIIVPLQRRNDPGTTHSIYVTLRAKHNESVTRPGTVDAASAGMPEAARKLYTDALESAQAGDNKKAVEQLNEALKLYPNFVSALNELGVQYMRLKRFDKAAESLRAALKIAPDAFYPRLNHGIALLQIKNFKEAAGELQIAVQKDNSSATAHFHFGRALVNLNQYDAAEIALLQAINLGGEEASEAHRYLGAVYIEKQDQARAATALETYLKLTPNAKDADKIRTIIKELRSRASNKH